MLIYHMYIYILIHYICIPNASGWTAATVPEYQWGDRKRKRQMQRQQGVELTPVFTLAPQITRQVRVRSCESTCQRACSKIIYIYIQYRYTPTNNTYRQWSQHSLLWFTHCHCLFVPHRDEGVVNRASSLRSMIRMATGTSAGATAKTGVQTGMDSEGCKCCPTGTGRWLGK